jgi:hypothetical protein
VLLGSDALAQRNEFVISGRLKVDGGSMSGSKIIVEKNGKQVKQIEGEAKFEIGLDFQAIYVISFQKEGFVTKRLRFDTHVPEDRIEYGFEPFGFTIEIFEQYDDVNMVVFNQPVGKISYSELIDEFDYDTDYTKSIQTQIDEAMDEVEEAKEKKTEQETQSAQQVANLTKAAEQSAKSGNTGDAIKSYEEALKLKKDPAIEQRISELKAQAEQEKKQAAFAQLMTDADKAMATGNLEEAKRLLGQANGVVANDPKVKQQLAKIEAEEKAQAQKAQAFADASKGAQSALASGNFDDAIAKAQAALAIKSDPSVEKVLADAQKAKAAADAKAAAEAAKVEQVNALMAEAQKAEGKGDLQSALGKLEEAKKVSPTPAIEDEIRKVKAAIASAEEEARVKAEQEAAAKAAEEEAKRKAEADAVAAKAAEEEAKRKAEAEATAAAKAAEEEAKRKAEAEATAAAKAAEEEAMCKAEAEAVAAKLADEEAKRKAEQEAKAVKQASEEELKAKELAAAQAAEEEAKRKADEAAAFEAQKRKAEELAAKKLEELNAKRAEADALLQANKLNQALQAYQGVLALSPGDEDAQRKIRQIQDLQNKLNAEKEQAKEAAVAITDQRGRESEQLATIIEQEESKAGANAMIDKKTSTNNASAQSSPSVDQANQTSNTAKPSIEQDVRPGAPVGPIVISENKVGDEARATRTGQMTDEEKYDSMMKRTEEEQQEFAADEAMKAMLAKYSERKTVETETVGNSFVTYVYINYGPFVKTFKKVEHNWGGVYYFVDGQATNQRYWEHETK